MFCYVKKFRSGFSVVEILLATALFSISLLASVSFFSQVNYNLSNHSNSLARTQLMQSLIYMFGMPTTIRGSLNHDTSTGMLWRSVRGNLGSIPATPLPISLFLPIIEGDATSVRTSGMISGTTNRPMQYSLDGRTCMPSPGVLCDAKIFSVMVTTEFLPVCPPRYDAFVGKWLGPINPNGLMLPPSCYKAHYIKIFYTFRPAPGTKPELAFSPVVGTCMVSVPLINAVI